MRVQPMLPFAPGRPKVADLAYQTMLV